MSTIKMDLASSPTVSNLAAQFQSISLDALNVKAAMLERQDNKYVLSSQVLHDVLHKLTDAFDVLEIDKRRLFTYDTCYFDDTDKRHYFDHHQGRRQRMKVRVRRYVDSRLCYVEVKLKDKRGMTVKRRMNYDVARYGQLDDLALNHIDSSHAQLYGRGYREPLAPVLDMSYQRVTLVAKAGGERMTIDSALQFDALGRQVALDRQTLIVETKSAHGNGLADHILRGAHQHPTGGCSKYCVGMSLTGSVSQYNRFLPAMRRLQMGQGASLLSTETHPQAQEAASMQDEMKQLIDLTAAVDTNQIASSVIFTLKRLGLKPVGMGRIDEIVRQVLVNRFSEARVTSFLPILVERHAVQLLRPECAMA